MSVTIIYKKKSRDSCSYKDKFLEDIELPTFYILYFHQLAKVVFIEKAVFKCATTHVRDVTSTVHATLDVFKDGRGDSII